MGTIDIAAADSVEIDLGEYQRPDESDRDALERALAEIASVGAGTLYLPPRRYTLSCPLVVAGAYVSITGDPGTVVHLHLADACVVDSSTHVFALTGEIHRACFRGLTIIGPGGDPDAGTDGPLREGERGACIGTAPGAVVHSLVVEDCVLSDRIVGVWLRFGQTVRGPFRFRRNRVRRVVRGVEVSTAGEPHWVGATARDVRFERNHILVERGSALYGRALTTVATLDVRLYANNLSGAGMAFEQASPWFGTLDVEEPPILPSASEFPDELTSVDDDLSPGMLWELRHRISFRYNFLSLTLSQVHDLSHNVFDGRRRIPGRGPDLQGDVAPIVELAHTFPIATGNIVANYDGEAYQGIVTRRRGVTAVGNVLSRLLTPPNRVQGFLLSPGQATRALDLDDDGVPDVVLPIDIRGSTVIVGTLAAHCQRLVGFPSEYVPSNPLNDALVVASNIASELSKEAVVADGWRAVSLCDNLLRAPYQNEVAANRSGIAALRVRHCETAAVSTNVVTQPPDLGESEGYSRPLRIDGVGQLSATANLFANATLAAKILTAVPVAPATGVRSIDVYPVTTGVAVDTTLEADNVLSFREGSAPPVETTQLLPIVTGETP